MWNDEWFGLFVLSLSFYMFVFYSGDTFSGQLSCMLTSLCTPSGQLLDFMTALNIMQYSCIYILWGPSRVLKLFTFTALLGLTVLLSHLLPCSSCQQQQQQLWEAVARRESGAGQQMELVESASGWAGGEDTTTGGAPQAHPLHQSKTKVLCNRLSRGKLT